MALELYRCVVLRHCIEKPSGDVLRKCEVEFRDGRAKRSLVTEKHNIVWRWQCGEVESNGKVGKSFVKAVWRTVLRWQRTVMYWHSTEMQRWSGVMICFGIALHCSAKALHRPESLRHSM